MIIYSFSLHKISRSNYTAFECVSVANCPKIRPQNRKGLNVAKFWPDFHGNGIQLAAIILFIYVLYLIEIGQIIFLYPEFFGILQSAWPESQPGVGNTEWRQCCAPRQVCAQHVTLTCVLKSSFFVGTLYIIDVQFSCKVLKFTVKQGSSKPPLLPLLYTDKYFFI